MPEAVIVSTARSPIGRANKGSLVDMRPDDLAAQMVRAALDKVPSLDPHDIDDLKLLMLAAKAMPDDEARKRMRAMRRQVLTHDVDAWQEAFLNDLAALRRRNDDAQES